MSLVDLPLSWSQLCFRFLYLLYPSQFSDYHLGHKSMCQNTRGETWTGNDWAWWNSVQSLAYFARRRDTDLTWTRHKEKAKLKSTCLMAKALCSVLCCKSDRLRCVRLTSPPAWSSVSRDSCFIFYNDNDSGNDDNNDSNILFLIYATFSYEPSKFKILRIWLNDGLKDWQRLKDYSRFFIFFFWDKRFEQSVAERQTPLVPRKRKKKKKI